MSKLRFTAPPMPHYIESGQDVYYSGAVHASRKDIGIFDLLVVTKGCLYLMEESREYEVSKNHYLILRPDRSHSTYQACKEETHFFWIHFQTLGSWSESTGSNSMLHPQSDDPYVRINQFACEFDNFGMLFQLAETYEYLERLERLRNQPYSIDRWKQQALFQELLLLLHANEVSKATPQLLVAEQAAAYLRTHFREPVSYSELSGAVHFHANYIARCMKQIFGCTPLEYLTRLRIEQAKMLLTHTDEPIGKIAEECGFGSFPFFIRCFTKHTEHRPRAYRMRFRE
jgi:AraC-like DNA-binding protein